MPSPFPGIDPFLEGQVWEEFHNLYIAELHRRLAPQLRPRYVVRLESRVYLEHLPGDIQLSFKPDLSLVGRSETEYRPSATAVASPPFTVPLFLPEEQKENYLEIRFLEGGEVVTVIEMLSPSNKRPGGDGLREYLAKRERVLRSSTHLVELDFLRGGLRLPMAAPMPPGEFCVLVSRANRRPLAEVWPFGLVEPLPTIPIPLADPDPDFHLDLQAVYSAVYEQAGYEAWLSRQQGTVPPLTTEQEAWATALLI